MSRSPQNLGGMPADIIGGTQAVTTQSFTELNSKLGSQFEATFYVAALAGGASTYLSFEVGDSASVLVKDISVQFNGELIQATLFVDPTTTGGVAIDAYSFNNGIPVVPDVTLMGGVTPSVNGAQVSPEVVSIGSQTQGNRALSEVGLGSGIERVLISGSKYLYEIKNLSNSATGITGVVSWYQGPLSTDQ